jgi:3-oxoacyl-[acyl-carrier protein] reductase
MRAIFPYLSFQPLPGPLVLFFAHGGTFCIQQWTGQGKKLPISIAKVGLSEYIWPVLISRPGETMMKIDLSGRIALVTGGSGGIGKSICATLAQSGATVAIGYGTNERGARDTLSACQGKGLIVQGDVGNPDQCRRIVETVVEQLGRIDLVVNNASIAEKDGPDMPFDARVSHWRHIIDVNLMSAVHIAHEAIPHMRRQGGGKIVTIASRSAFRGETEYLAYAASKAAQVNLTRSLARTCAGDNILVYCVAPGFIEAGMGVDEIAEHEAEIRSQIPSGRIGTAEDVANVVLFLASDLSNYMTGSTLDVNGGSYLH